MRDAYCLDSSGILDGWKRFYPSDIFPALEAHVSELADTKRILIPQDIVLELKRLDDQASVWTAGMKHCHIVPDQAIQEKVAEILGSFPKLVGAGNSRSAGDPWVIATAAIYKAIVVTGEQGGSASKPKIPYVCEKLGVQCISFTELLRRERWQFSRKI